MPVPIFHDSWKRLEWVEHLAARASIIVTDILHRNETIEVSVECRTVGEFTHARVWQPEPAVIGDELGFLIADVAVNARSCLDMAISAAVLAAGVKVHNPQFPILDDVTDWTTGKGLTGSLHKAFPPYFVESVKTLQPVHDTDFGYLGIPLNMLALVIREVANANKHRNLTPVLHTATERGLMRGVNSLEYVYADESAWNPLDDVLVEVRFPSNAPVGEDAIVNSVFANFELQLIRSKFHYGGIEKDYVLDHGLDIPINVKGLLNDVPKFVRHALLVMEYGITNGKSGKKPQPYQEWWDALP